MRQSYSIHLLPCLFVLVFCPKINFHLVEVLNETIIAQISMYNFTYSKRRPHSTLVLATFEHCIITLKFVKFLWTFISWVRCDFQLIDLSKIPFGQMRFFIIWTEIFEMRTSIYHRIFIILFSNTCEQEGKREIFRVETNEDFFFEWWTELWNWWLTWQAYRRTDSHTALRANRWLRCYGDKQTLK